jgi:membrane associated rhomboid family serine protease
LRGAQYTPVIDEEPLDRLHIPWMVIALVAINGLCWMLQLREGESFTNALATVPYEISHGVDVTDVHWVAVGGQFLPIQHAAGPHPIYLTMVSSMFLHGSWMHIIGNMLYLAVFGPPIERRTGPWRFFAFYAVCGVVADLAHVLSDADSMIPSIGASGAIAGILGAYVLTFPLEDVPIIVRIFSFGPFTPKLPAVMVFGIWLLLQWEGYFQSSPGQGGVAFMAHIGGFIAGLVLAAFLVPNEKPPPPRRHGWVSH